MRVVKAAIHESFSLPESIACIDYSSFGRDNRRIGDCAVFSVLRRDIG